MYGIDYLGKFRPSSRLAVTKEIGTSCFYRILLCSRVL